MMEDMRSVTMKPITKFVVMPAIALTLIAGCTVIAANNAGVVESAHVALETTPTPTPAQVSAPATPTTPTPALATHTKAQDNAIRMAERYLDYTSFSRKGLIAQLEFEGFSTEDATFALDELEPFVSWEQQAWLKGSDYLDYQPMSRTALIAQLEFEGFTEEQATFAADSLGL